MAVTFPGDNENIRCPHCRAECAYQHFRVTEVRWDIKGGRTEGRHMIRVAYCTSCGQCIIQRVAGRGNADTVIYPTAPTRENAPALIRDTESYLAESYDEAVACEPHSLNAAMFLLGRCVEIILVRKLGAPTGTTLGPQIDHVIEAKTLTDPLAGYLNKAFKSARNQSGHLWTDANGNEMKVDDESVDCGFTVVKMMFEQFYLHPLKMSSWESEMQQKFTEKVQGDNR